MQQVLLAAGALKHNALQRGANPQLLSLHFSELASKTRYKIILPALSQSYSQQFIAVAITLEYSFLKFLTVR